MKFNLKVNLFTLFFTGFALASAVFLGYLFLKEIKRLNKSGRNMLLAPMIGVVEPCLTTNKQTPRQGISDMSATCTGANGSAAALIEETLTFIEGQEHSKKSNSRLGYTLPVPVLQLFKATSDGWILDSELISRISNTIHASDRQLILYLFSTHFSTGAPLEVELAKDPANLAQTQDGTLSQGSYYGKPINHWSISDFDNNITKRRMEGINGLMNELCKLSEIDLKKITAVTLLGEIHHFFPNFESGMGFDDQYIITDYSPLSSLSFQRYLKSKFQYISKLNEKLKSNFSDFSEIPPPSKNIRTDKLNTLTEHIDSYAHGFLPVSGWAHIRNNKKSPNKNQIYAYLNGKLIRKVNINRNRQDVLKAHPEFEFADTGWRFDLDFRMLKKGIHKIDIFLRINDSKLIFLGDRKIIIINNDIGGLVKNHSALENHVITQSKEISFNIETPKDNLNVFYNALVEEWHSFRSKQVSQYLTHFVDILKKSCLKNTPIFTHQILPTANPGWDENKFAVNTLSIASKGIQPGYSLYGDATFNNYFPLHMIQANNLRYGVTEFHPLKPMTPMQVDKIFEQHRRQGALFLSFFMEPRWNNQLVHREHNIFSIDPQNKQFSSDILFESIREVLKSRTSD